MKTRKLRDRRQSNSPRLIPKAYDIKSNRWVHKDRRLYDRRKP